MAYLSGVIEGFYGQPWSWSNRCKLVNLLPELGLNTYFYAPKFDIHHRVNWREPYSRETLAEFNTLSQTARNNKVNLVLSLSPGLSFEENDIDILIKRFIELADINPSGLALLMDDIPYDVADAQLQCKTANLLRTALPDTFNWYFCPTAYSRWHLKTWDGATDYLKIIGQQLPHDWQVFWTGNTVISKTITADDLTDVTEYIQRKPLIWDNFSADDYVPAHSMFPGPVTGRSGDVIDATSGFLLNPSQIFSSSMTALFSVSRWLKTPDTYVPDQAFTESLAWIVKGSVCTTPLNHVMGYFYGPFSVSPQWTELLEQFKSYLQGKCPSNPFEQFENIRNQLRDDQNIVTYGDVWMELYPFVRTVLGDLDYLITACRKYSSGTDLAECLPKRDPRWSGPLNDLLFELKSGDNSIV